MSEVIAEERAATDGRGETRAAASRHAARSRAGSPERSKPAGIASTAVLLPVVQLLTGSSQKRRAPASPRPPAVQSWPPRARRKYSRLPTLIEGGGSSWTLHLSTCWPPSSAQKKPS